MTSGFPAGRAVMTSTSLSFKSFRITLTFSSESSACTGVRVLTVRLPASRPGKYDSGFIFFTHKAHASDSDAGASLDCFAGGKAGAFTFGSCGNRRQRVRDFARLGSGFLAVAAGSTDLVTFTGTAKAIG